MGDYYQGIVVNYLRADRSIFVNPECYIQIQPGPQPPKGSSWYCDVLAVDFGSSPSDPTTVFLCEVSYSESLQRLIKRLKEWNDHWQEIRDALVKYNRLPAEWAVRPWLFVPRAKGCAEKLIKALEYIDQDHQLSFKPRITPLEMVVPWEYEWDRTEEKPKPDIPRKWSV